MEYFEKELEKRSNGRIDVENYFGAVVGNGREMMDMVATGALQCTCGGMFTRHKKLERLTVLRH